MNTKQLLNGKDCGLAGQARRQFAIIATSFSAPVCWPAAVLTSAIKLKVAAGIRRIKVGGNGAQGVPNFVQRATRLSRKTATGSPCNCAACGKCLDRRT